MKYPDARNIKKGKQVIESAPLNDGVEKLINNKTPARISRKNGWMFVTCGVCGVEFEKTAYKAMKVSNHYCSRQCAGIAKRRRILCHCKMCGAKMLVIPAMFAKTTTCSDECSKRMKQAIEQCLPRDNNNQNWANRDE